MMYSVFFYIIDLLLFRYRQTREELEDVRQINQMLEQHQQSMADASDSNLPTSRASSPSHSCILHSQYGDLVLEIASENILYIESVANYLSIWYFDDGELKQKRIRNTLKNVEETLAGHPFLLHCHRAFLVNTHFITHVDGNAAGCQLHLFSIDRTVPVSKANIDALRQALNINK